MKKLVIEYDDDDDDPEAAYQTAVGSDEGIACVDWKASPDEIFEEFDKQLAKHGLEIEMIDDGMDEYTWRIVQRGEG